MAKSKKTEIKDIIIKGKSFIIIGIDYKRREYLEKLVRTNKGRMAKSIEDNLDYQQAVLDIKRKYKERFLKVLSPQQLTDLQQAEREFRQVLMQRMKERRGQGGNGPNRGGMRRRSN